MAVRGLQCLAWLVLLIFSSSAYADDFFPEYDSIRPNVAFWLDIYAKYPSTRGVLHDGRNLGIVYEVLEVEGVWDTAARDRDRIRIDVARSKYRGMLDRLAAGETPRDQEERRVADLFGPTATSADFLGARDNIRFQSGQKDRFKEGLIRSGAHLAEIRRIFADYGLPEDLAFLPHVESSFNYNAYSKVGAAGVWQFTESTGRQFLTIDQAIDERRDPLKSTHAAAKLLKRNYEKLGSWPLALTAYNHGLNGMLRAKAVKGDYERIFLEHESPLFKFASRNFYPEFLAAREVARNYKDYFGSLRLDAPVSSKAVILANRQGLAPLIKHLGVDVATFRALNPSLREPVYSGQSAIPGGFELRIPEQARVVRLASALSASAPEEKPSADVLHYQVRTGDTPFSIAARYGVSVPELMAANGFDDRGVILSGQTIRIPVGGGSTALTVALDSKTALAPRSGGLIPVAPVEPPLAVKAGAERGEAVPAPQGVRIELTANAKPRPEPTAQAAMVPVAGGGVVSPAVVDAMVVKANLAVKRVEHGPAKGMGLIRVEADETLSLYAAWLSVSSDDLRKLNGLRPGQGLELNRALRIPLARVSKEHFEEQRYSHHKELVENFLSNYRVVGGTRSYLVKRGDTIWSLCQNQFSLPIWLVKRYNATLDLNRLKSGQTLIVPRVEAIG